MADLPDEEVAARGSRFCRGPKPFDKLRLVRLLLREWGVVAAGAGTNDAPAFRRADVELTVAGPRWRTRRPG